MNNLYKHLMDLVNDFSNNNFSTSFSFGKELSEKIFIIPPKRKGIYLKFQKIIGILIKNLEKQIAVADRLYALNKTLLELDDEKDLKNKINDKISTLKLDFDARNQKIIDDWQDLNKSYLNDFFTFNVRGKDIKIATSTESFISF